MKNFSITGIYADLYQLTKGTSHQEAVFDYYFRKLPFQGGYVSSTGSTWL